MSFWFVNFCCVGHWALVPLSLNYSIVGDRWCFLSLALVLIDTLDWEIELWVFFFDSLGFIRAANERFLRWCYKHGSRAGLPNACCLWWLIATQTTANRKVAFFQLLCLLCHLTLSCSETIICFLYRAALIDAIVGFFSMPVLLERCQRSVVTICSAVANVDSVSIRYSQLANFV